MATVKEIKLKKNGAMVSPVVLIDSLKNLDGTKYKDTVTSALNGKANSSHSHDDRYYTESEITNLLNGKADNSHTHSYAPIPVYKVVTTATENDIVRDGEYGWVARIPDLQTGQIAFVNIKAFCENRSQGLYWEQGDLGGVKTPNGGSYAIVNVNGSGKIEQYSGNTVIYADETSDDGYIYEKYLVLRLS